MFESLRKYQRYFLFLVTFMIIFSFLFFGTFSTFADDQNAKDLVLTRKVGGSKMTLFEVQKLSRFLSSDQEDFIGSSASAFNLCNDGVIRTDFFQTGLVELIASRYFSEIEADLKSRLQKIKHYSHYQHPQNPSISVENAWGYFIPEISEVVLSLKKQEKADLQTLSYLIELYELQGQFPPHILRQVLSYQQQGVSVDPRLRVEDLSLFGFHSGYDWFGPKLIDLISQFILNVADLAREKGYQVSLEEARGDLIYSFDKALSRYSELNGQIDLNAHLRSLGYDQTEAAKLWREVLLFRRYFEDVGSSVFLDKEAVKQVHRYAHEESLVKAYRWPIQLKTKEDLASFELYVQAVGKEFEKGLPISIASVEEIAKLHPELVQKTYRAEVSKVVDKQVGLMVPVQQVWAWEQEDKNWNLLADSFSLDRKTPAEKRFSLLSQLDLSMRSTVDAWAREKMVKEHPEWIDQALEKTPFKEEVVSLAYNETPFESKKGVHFRVKDLKVEQEGRLLSFEEAKPVLKLLIKKENLAKIDPNKGPFQKAVKAAFSSIEKEKESSLWVQKGEDLILDQFKLQVKEEKISRSSKEGWMKKEAFAMPEGIFSPIQVENDGDVVFFYLEGKKAPDHLLPNQLSFLKQSFASDAKRYVAEKVLDTIELKHAIVISTQKEDE